MNSLCTTILWAVKYRDKITGEWYCCSTIRKGKSFKQQSVFSLRKQTGLHAGSQWWYVLAGTDRGSAAMDPVIICCCTFLLYLCSKLDLLLSLISCQEFFYQRASFCLPASLSLLLFQSDSPTLFFSPFLSLPWNCRADTEQKQLMLIKIRKHGDVRRLLGQAGTQTFLVYAT